MKHKRAKNMKKILLSKNFLILFLSILFITIEISSNSIINNQILDNENNRENENENGINVGIDVENGIDNEGIQTIYSHYNLPRSSYDPVIDINNNGDLDLFCEPSQDGTIGNPYIIEDFIINATGTAGISISSTSKYLIIRNCTIFDPGVENGDAGIYLGVCDNVNITNNTIFRWVDSRYEAGIILFGCDNINVTNNHITGLNDYGIDVSSTDNSNIINNTFTKSRYRGMELTFSENNLIANNTFEGSGDEWITIIGEDGEYGLYASANSFNNIISGNIFGGFHKYGIIVSNCYNEVIGNNCTRNAYAGIYMDDADGSIVDSNNVYENNGSGIHIYSTPINVTNNFISDNYQYDIRLQLSANCNITGNYGDPQGISRIHIGTNSITNKFRNNSLYKSGFLMDTTIYADFDESNTVNDKTVYYKVHQDGFNLVNISDVGQLVLANVSNANIEGLNISDCSIPIGLYTCENITLKNNNCSNAEKTGIHVYYSDNVTLIDNICENNGMVGIRLYITNNNKVISNECFLNIEDGISVESSDNNYIYDNLCYNNSQGGIYVDRYSDNSDIVENICNNNSGWGIYSYVDYGNVTRNVCNNNTMNGIYFSGDNSTIIDNNCSKNLDVGIEASSIQNGNITGNICNYNLKGFYIASSSYVNISGNYAAFNTEQGLEIYYMNYANCSDNHLEFNNDGFEIYSSDYNTVCRNIINNNSNYGIYLNFFSEYNAIFQNNATNNSVYGIYVGYNSNDIFWNNFIQNDVNLYNQYTSNEYWKYNRGNYWDDYSGSDTDGDGIGDTIAYAFSPSGSDIYPVMNPLDLTGDYIPPEWVDPPVNISLSIGETVNYDINATDNVAIDEYWTNSTSKFNIDSSGVLTNTSILELPIYFIEVYVNDSNGNRISTIINITTPDVTPPSWDEIPTDQIVEYGVNFSYDVNASDSVEIDLYWINDTSSFQIDNNNGIIVNKTLLSVGIYWIKISVNDTSNNIIDQIIKITCQDTTPPVISDEADIPSFEFGTEGASITWSLILELNPDSWEILIDGVSQFNITYSSPSQSISLDGIALGGPYNYTCRLNDTSGNIIQDTVWVTVVDTTAPVFEINPLDILNYELGTIGNKITWNLTELNPSYYELFIDNIGQGVVAWDGSNLTLNIDGLTIGGPHNITLVVNDTSNNRAQDQVDVNVVDTIIPEMTNLVEFSDQLELGNTAAIRINVSDYSGISSVLIEIDGVNYSMAYISGDLYENNSWTPNSLGVKSYIIWAEDNNGLFNSVSDNINVIDTTSPSLNNINKITDPLELGDTIIIRINVTDLSPIDSVEINYDGTNYSMSYISGDMYQFSAWMPNSIGLKGFTIYANDTSGNTNFIPSTVNVIDSNAPLLGDLEKITDPLELGAPITIRINITDLSPIHSVVINYDGINHSMNYISGNMYQYTSWTPDSIGLKGFTIYANDSTGNTDSISDIFNVQDTLSPILNNLVKITDPLELGVNVIIRINVSDYSPIDLVVINYDGVNHSMNYISGDMYQYLSWTPDSIGLKPFTIYANDTQGNTDSILDSIDVQDSGLPLLSDHNDFPDPAEFNEVVIIRINATDTSGIDEVKIEIEGSNRTMNYIAGDMYEYSYIPSSIGLKPYTIYVKDNLGMINSSSYSVLIQDTLAPKYSELVESADPLVLGNEVTISVDITDPSVLDTVLINIGGKNISMSLVPLTNTYKYSWTPISVGIINYIIFSNDTHGNSDIITGSVNVVFQKDPVIINAISNWIFHEFQTEGNISWQIIDTTVFNPYYIIYINGSQNSTQIQWTTETIVTFSLDSLNVGLYNITLVAYDGIESTASHSYWVTIYKSEDLFASTLDLVRLSKGSEEKIIWKINLDLSVIGLDSLRYMILQNGVQIPLPIASNYDINEFDGVWNGSDIELSISGLSKGDYNFTLILENGAGGFIEKSILVEIIEKADLSWITYIIIFGIVSIAGITGYGYYRRRSRSLDNIVPTKESGKLYIFNDITKKNELIKSRSDENESLFDSLDDLEIKEEIAKDISGLELDELDEAIKFVKKMENQFDDNDI